MFSCSTGCTEKAIKALLIQNNIEFPYVHDLSRLLTLLEGAGQEIPESVKQVERLTRFAVFTRYPGISPPVTQEEYKEAVSLAEKVVRWAEGVVEFRSTPPSEEHLDQEH